MNVRTPRSILKQARKLGPDVTEMRAIKHTMELIAHSLCVANSALAKVAQEGWPGKPALLNGQSMGPKSELSVSRDQLVEFDWRPLQLVCPNVMNSAHKQYGPEVGLQSQQADNAAPSKAGNSKIASPCARHLHQTISVS